MRMREKQNDADIVHLHCLHRNGESCDSRCPRRSQRCLVHRCLLSYVGVSHQTFNLAPSLFQHLHCLHRHGESFAAGVSPQKCPLYVLSYVGVSCIVRRSLASDISPQTLVLTVSFHSPSLPDTLHFKMSFLGFSQRC